MKMITTLALGAWVCAMFTACELNGGAEGPGTGPGGDVEPGTVELPSAAALDGWVRSDGNLATSGAPITGDLDAAAPGMGYRQFYSFDLSSLPPGGVVTAATLRVYQSSTAGTPYVDLGNVIVDHVNYGDDLDPTDYNAAALAGNIGVISNNATVGLKTLSVTARVQADLGAGRTRSQFRLRFSNSDSNNDGGSDFAQFDAAEAPVNPPRLVVSYQ